MELDSWEFTALITRMRRVLRTSVRSQLPWETLPMAQIEILQRLDDEPRLRVRDLAERHRLAPNTVSTLVQQMVTAGLVNREPDPTDRRAVTITATATGRAALAGWLAANEQRLSGALSALSGTDRRRIAAAMPALVRLVAQLEADESVHRDR